MITHPSQTPRNYQPCDICRHTPKGYKDYKMDSWFINVKRPALTHHHTDKFLDGMARMQHADKNFKLLVYPAYNKNVADIEAALDRREDLEGFVPDVVLIDYADILAPEDEDEKGRDRIDTTWKSMRRMAATRKILVATVTQSNRLSFDKKIVRAVHASEDIRKMAHVILMATINQTPVEKKAGVMRLGLAAHRHKDFDESETVSMLQSMAMGQPLIDSARGHIERMFETE